MRPIWNIVIPLLISLSCLLCAVSFAQQGRNEFKPDQYRVVHWTDENGLPSNLLNTFFKDAKGFLWIGSLGGELSRFDGSIFKKYFPENVKSGAINSDTVIVFEEDSLHNIWIGTQEGISRYDIKADTFTNFSPYIDSPFTQLDTRRLVVPFWATKDSIYCIEPGGLVTAFNIHTLKRKKLLQLAKEDDPGLGWNANQSVFDERSKSIWVLRQRGPVNNKLQQIFLDGKVIYYQWPCYRKDVVHYGHDAEDMHYDAKRNSIWINSGDGLLEFSLTDKQFHPVDAMNDLLKLKEFYRYVGIDIDQKGRIWFATNLKGILIYDPQTKQLKPALSDTILQPQAGVYNLHIYIDRDGIVWTSNWNQLGIYQLIPFEPLAKRYTANPGKKDSLSSGLISTIVPGPGGKLWIGTADGLNIFDPVSETFEVLRQKDLPGLKGTAILPLYIDTIQQKAWLNAGTHNIYEYYSMKMYEMDVKTKLCKPIVLKDGSAIIDKFSIPHTLIKPYKDGLIFCDERHGVFEIKKGSLVANLMISFTTRSGFGGMTLVEDRYLFLQGGGQLPNNTFENKDGKWTKTANPLDSLFYSVLLYNKKDKTYWAGLIKELRHYDDQFRLIRSYGRQDGYGTLILGMLMDNNDNIWFANQSKRVGQLNMTTGIISFLSESDGYYKQEYDWYIPSEKDTKGNIYFGVGGSIGAPSVPPHLGLDRINPNLYSSVVTSSVYLRSIFVNQKPYSLTSDPELLKELLLKYNQNTIRIDAGIIDFFSKQKGQIRYKLERSGKAGDWEYSLDHTIRYEDLPPGSYRLTLQAANANNEFNSLVKTFNIRINPPFWQTWWFRILAAVFITSLIYGIIHYRSRVLRKQNILLEEKVLTRTKELKNSLEELSATQAQLIQSEKMASLGELTAGIAHEIQNPLNFVNNFSEVNKEIIAEMKEAIDKADYDEVKLIANDLEENSEKINHHGKRADAIVKGMLQHSKAGSGQKEPTDINKLTDEYLRLAYHGLRAKDKSFNAEIKTDFDESIGNINIIPQDIGRVILNLINNAFYAVDEKKKLQPGNYEPTVLVSTKKMVDKISIRVKDNGNGIPEKIVDKIFQPFFTTKPTGQGTGLGLSLAYDIIKAHGGELKVKTKENEGSEFIILLPVI